ncbi:MAG: hypothetical protein ABNO52_00630 [Candidatus Shikimatogenerans sp. Tser]|uniref:Uncharacterized protein n=1 Tax=Candidatus Shikimatogenerans sp. Tser TaxID=3158568 RepID=A0AAU7QRF3_9FLAO
MIYFINIKNIKSNILVKIRKKFYKKKIIMKIIKNSIYKKFINNKKLLKKQIIKDNLTILIYKKKSLDKEKNIKIPLKIISKFIKKYNIIFKIIKAIYIKNKIYYKKKDINLIKKVNNKKHLYTELNKIIYYNIYNFFNYINYYIYNMIIFLFFLKNVKQNSKIS